MRCQLWFGDPGTGKERGRQRRAPPGAPISLGPGSHPGAEKRDAYWIQESGRGPAGPGQTEAPIRTSPLSQMVPRKKRGTPRGSETLFNPQGLGQRLSQTQVPSDVVFRWGKKKKHLPHAIILFLRTRDWQPTARDQGRPAAACSGKYGLIGTQPHFSTYVFKGTVEQL